VTTLRPPEIRLHLGNGELIVDNFAGGGGASLGIQWALGRAPDIAINHSRDALAMHEANHPSTRHLCEDVWDVDPLEACGGRPVGLAWFSPDCTHFSRAKGGKPRSGKIRGLAWVVVRWARCVRPRVIILENVEEFLTWGPLRNGQPDPQRAGQTFKHWKAKLERLGYVVDYRLLRASDYGAPTIRRRLFLVARCDGKPIRWPAPTHGDGPGLMPVRPAADVIHWHIPCPSILHVPARWQRPRCAGSLAGFAASCTTRPSPSLCRSLTREMDVCTIAEPARTITGSSRSPFAIVAPTMIQTSYGERPGQAPRSLDLSKPLGTVVAGGQKHALVAAFLAKHYGGHEATGARLGAPVSTITAQDHHALVASHLLKLHGSARDGREMSLPLPTVRAQGMHLAEVRALLVKYYGQGTGQDLRDPLHTVPAHDRFGLVTIHGDDYVIGDIGMRMLQPRELFAAQGFPDTYVIDMGAAGNQLTKTAQIRMCGNSVVPQVAAAVVRVNLTDTADAAVLATNTRETRQQLSLFSTEVVA
jgi:DNA (cytosine-5)-methyltransferase 1